MYFKHDYEIREYSKMIMVLYLVHLPLGCEPTMHGF